jgi:hypothetical protein
MKFLFASAKSCLLLGLFTLAACNKDDDATPVNLDKFYRLDAYEIGVIPEQRMVQVLFQVTDFYRKGITTLTADDFIVSENDGRIDSEAEIRLGRGKVPFVIKNVLLLDVSRSVEGFIPQIKTAAKALVEKKLDYQEIAVYTFDAEVTEVQSFTTDKADLIAAIENIPESNLVNSTNLFGAVQELAPLWEDAYAIEGIVDGSMIIFTDGRHNAAPSKTLSTAKSALGDRRVYVAALNSPDLDEPSLKSLATITDRYFKADDVAGLEQMFLDIQEEIQLLANSIYFLYYQSPISDPAPFINTLTIEVNGNINSTNDRIIVEKFNSEGFGN